MFNNTRGLIRTPLSRCTIRGRLPRSAVRQVSQRQFGVGGAGVGRVFILRLRSGQVRTNGFIRGGRVRGYQGSVYYSRPFSFVQGETIALNGFATEDKPFMVNHPSTGSLGFARDKSGQAACRQASLAKTEGNKEEAGLATRRFEPKGRRKPSTWALRSLRRP